MKNNNNEEAVFDINEINPIVILTVIALYLLDELTRNNYSCTCD